MQELPNINTDTDGFVFVIHGFAPEFSDGIAFRTDKSAASRRRKNIICPHCSGVFDTVDYRTKIEVFRYSSKSGANVHKTRKCKACRGVVAVRFS